jgi:hypothetical protein
MRWIVARKTIGEYAYEYLKANDHDGAMWGDAHLLHEIAEAAGRPHRSWRTEKAMLQALERSPLFVKGFVSLGGPKSGHRLVRIFYRHDALPKHWKGRDA